MPDLLYLCPILLQPPPFLRSLRRGWRGRWVSLPARGGGDNQLTAIPIAVGPGSGMGVMTSGLLVARGLVVELCGLMVAVCGLLPEGIVKLISRCEIVIANRDIMISHRETVISNPEINIKTISVRMMAVGDALGVGVVIRVCFHIP